MAQLHNVVLYLQNRKMCEGNVNEQGETRDAD